MVVRPRTGGRLAGIVVLVLCGVLAVGPAASGSGATEADRDGPRRELLELTNRDRDRRDRDLLAFSAELSRYARRHSQAMARRGSLFHSSDDQLRAVLGGVRWSIAGENVGVGSSLEGLQDAFMASPLHRRNVLRSTFERAAIGIARAHGRLWVTVIFFG